MLQDEHNPLFLQYLYQYQAEIEQKLLYPKNDWRRIYQLRQDLEDLQKRISLFEYQSHRQTTTTRHRKSRDRQFDNLEVLAP